MSNKAAAWPGSAGTWSWLSPWSWRGALPGRLGQQAGSSTRAQHLPPGLSPVMLGELCAMRTPIVTVLASQSRPQNSGAVCKAFEGQVPRPDSGCCPVLGRTVPAQAPKLVGDPALVPRWAGGQGPGEHGLSCAGSVSWLCLELRLDFARRKSLTYRDPRWCGPVPGVGGPGFSPSSAVSAQPAGRASSLSTLTNT